MPLSAANSMPIQTGGVAGAPAAPARPSASILMRRPAKKKKPEEETAAAAPSGKPNASILFGRKK